MVAVAAAGCATVLAALLVWAWRGGRQGRNVRAALVSQLAEQNQRLARMSLGLGALLSALGDRGVLKPEQVIRLRHTMLDGPGVSQPAAVDLLDDLEDGDGFGARVIPSDPSIKH